MNSARGRIPAIVATLVILGLGTRMVWTVSRTEIGWEAVRDQWLGAFFGLSGLDLKAIAKNKPFDEATFWVAESQRIRREFDDSETAEGVAWVLDQPGLAILIRQLSARSVSSTYGAKINLGERFDRSFWQVIESKKDEFERHSRDELHAAIEAATASRPDIPAVWRSRALLAFRSGLFFHDPAPRRLDWLAELDECAAHDPENALYDYQAAVQLLSESTTYSGEPRRIIVHDPLKYEQANQHFASGQAKPHLQLNSNAYAAALQFLEHASIAPLDRVSIAEGLSMETKGSLLLIAIGRWRLASLNDHLSRGESNVAQMVLNEISHLSQQMTRAGNVPNLIPLLNHQWALDRSLEAASKNPRLFTQQQLSAINDQQRNVRLERAVLEMAFRHVSEERKRPESSGQAAELVVWATQSLTLILTAIAFVSALASRILLRFDAVTDVRLGSWRQLIAWSLGFAGSFVIFGLCSTEVISSTVQTWTFRTTVCLIPGLAFVAFLIGVHARSRVRWDELMALLTSGLLLCALCIYPGAVWDWLVGFVSGLSLATFLILLALVPLLGGWLVYSTLQFARNTALSMRVRSYVAASLLLSALWIVFAVPPLLNYICSLIPDQNWVVSTRWSVGDQGTTTTALVLRDSLQFRDRKFFWAVAVWAAERGLLTAPIASLAILGGWFAFRCSRGVNGGVLVVLRSKPLCFFNAAVRMIARSATTAATVALMTYLLVAPELARTTDLNYRERVAALRDTDQAWREVDGAIAAVRSDKILMNELREKSKND